MAIISIKTKKNGLSHSADLKSRNYTVELIAQVDDLATGPIALRSQLATWGFVAGTPYQWPLPPATPTETDPTSLLNQIECSQDSNDGLTYAITLHYGQYDQDESPAQGTQLNQWIMAPWLAAPTLKWSSEDEDYYPTHDRDGTPILNSAADPFDPGPSISMPTPIATITRVEQGFLPAWITQYKGTVNDAPWMGFPAESVLCKDITADLTRDPDWGPLYAVNYTFAFRPVVLSEDESEVIVSGWDAQIANLGKRRIVAGKPEEIRDKDGQPISDPVFLDPDDGSYDHEAPPPPNFLRFPLRPKADFDFFNFPASLFDYSPGP